MNFFSRYAVQTDSKFGFVTPFDHHEHYTGVVKNFELSAAFKAAVGFDLESGQYEVSIRAANRNNKQVIFMYNTIPYTSNYNLVNLKPALEQSGTERIYAADAGEVNNCINLFTYKIYK